MNKQELIKKYEHMNHDCFRRVDVSEILSDLIRLEKPQKVKIPKFVAEYIENARASDWDLEYTFRDIDDELGNTEISEWFYKQGNIDIFARAWLDGYTVEKEAKYTVKIKGNLGQYLGRYYLNNEELTPQFIRTQQNDPSYFTKAELEQTGFGWVFDCEGIEVEEVE